MMASFLPLLTEQVSTPEIKVLNLTRGNGNCSLTLACDVEKGDYVVYNWSEELATDPLTPANNSTHLLHLNLGPQNVNNVYVCTVSNPISSRSRTFTPKSQCRLESFGECPGGGGRGTLRIWAQSSPGLNDLLP